MPPSEPDALAVHGSSPDGIRLSAWIAAAPISRATSYELLRVLGITPMKARVAGSRADVSFLSNEQVAVIDAAAARVKGGARLSDLATALSPATHPEPSADDHQTIGPIPGPELLLARLEAGELAIRSGLPLSTAEVGWIMGARPGAAVVTRGRVTARRQARNVWSLEPSRDG